MYPEYQKIVRRRWDGFQLSKAKCPKSPLTPHFDPVLSLFRYGLVLPVTGAPGEGPGRRRRRFLFVALSCLFTVLLVAASAWQVSTSQNSWTMASFVGTVIASVHRWILCFRRDRLLALCRRASRLHRQLDVRPDDSPYRTILGWGAANCLLILPFYVCVVLSILLTDTLRRNYGVLVDLPAPLKYLGAFLCPLSYLAVITVPVLAFCTCYALLCQHARDCIEAATRDLAHPSGDKEETVRAQPFALPVRDSMETSRGTERSAVRVQLSCLPVRRLVETSRGTKEAMVQVQRSCMPVRDLVETSRGTKEAMVQIQNSRGNEEATVRVQRSCLAVRGLVESADDHLSLLVFVSTLYSAVSVYFALSTVLHPEDYSGAVESACTWVMSLIGAVSFANMTVAASGLRESAARLGLAAERAMLGGDDGRLPSKRQKQLLAWTRKDLHLTAWKIVPISRSYILATMGTIITYCLLFDNLRSSATTALFIIQNNTKSV